MKSISTIPKFGDVSKDVATIQQALRDLALPAYDPGSVDGIWGIKTQNAMIAFQKHVVGTSGTGLMGPKTIKLLGLQVLAIDPVETVLTITQDLHGKKDRHIHPNARVFIESKVFPDREVPKIFTEKNLPAVYSYIADKLTELGWHEKGGNNMGPEVGWVQGVTGPYSPGGNHDAWCLDWAQIIFALIEDYYGIESPVAATAHVLTCWNEARKVANLTSMQPTAGALACGNYTGTTSGHAMPTISLKGSTQMVTSEGNTSIENMSDGDGSGKKIRNTMQNGSLKTLGWVYAYPGNKVPSAS